MRPVAPSAVQPKAEAFDHNERGEDVVPPYVKPRTLQVEELPWFLVYNVSDTKQGYLSWLGVEIA